MVLKFDVKFHTFSNRKTIQKRNVCPVVVVYSYTNLRSESSSLLLALGAWAPIASNLEEDDGTCRWKTLWGNVPSVSKSQVLAARSPAAAGLIGSPPG